MIHRLTANEIYRNTVVGISSYTILWRNHSADIPQIATLLQTAHTLIWD